MPENFASLLEALNDEGRALAQPAPAGVIETLGKARRRRHRFTAATSAVAVCAIAVGVVVNVGGASRRPMPTTPTTTPTTAPTTHQAEPAKNRTGVAALMQASELPQPGLFQWSLDSTDDHKVNGGLPMQACGFEESEKGLMALHPQSQTVGMYSGSYQQTAQELVFHYGSAAAARADYDQLKPDPATCPTAHVVATVPDGYAWNDVDRGTTQKMIVVSGSDIAYFFLYQEPGTPYDSSGDQATLQRMADRLEGRTPVPDPSAANALPGSAWVPLGQIPFGTADQSVNGWTAFPGQQQSAGGNPPSSLCAAVTDGEDFVAEKSDSILTRMYHGTPANTPDYPGTNYLYSDASESIVSFPGGATDASAAFDKGKQLLTTHSCQFTDGSGAKDTRTVTTGTTTDNGFSLLVTDKPGPDYKHVYCVVKGSHMAWMVIDFEHGDTSTSGDAAILANMASRLP